MTYTRPSIVCRGYRAMKRCFIMASPVLMMIAGADKHGNLLQRSLHSICYETGQCLRNVCEFITNVWNYGIDQTQDVLDSESDSQQRIIIASVVIGAYSLLLVTYLWRSAAISRRIKSKQELCQSSITQLKGRLKQLPPKKLDAILSCNFLEIRSKLRSGELTAMEVLSAYQGKALRENDRLNFIVDIVEEAEQLAETCDKSTTKDRPLHGIPISIKENYYIKDYYCTGGMSPMLSRGARTDDGPLIKVLKHQGAIPYVRTNIPQSMMTFECSNPIFGCTINPHNLKRGPGGSSGGEGAILGSEASILGWGNDIGGSLRIPSRFCGICCLKPTAGRLSGKSSEGLDGGLIQTLIKPTDGPMARDVDTVVEAMKAVLCPYHFELDPEVPPIPFNTEVYESKRPLRIGYYSNDGYVTPIPGVKRGLDMAVQALKDRGHELVEFEVPNVKEMFTELFMKICFGDGCKHFMDLFEDDTTDPSIQMLVGIQRLPICVQTCISYLASWILNDKTTGEQARAMQGVGSVVDWWSLTSKLNEYRQSFIQQWKDLNLDAIVCPTMPYVAPPTGAVQFLIGGVTYTALYNTLNFPSGCVPVTKVTAVDETLMKDYPSNIGVEKFIKKYFSADTGGLPVTVQCVGLPYNEELVLRVMKEVEIGVKSLK